MLHNKIRSSENIIPVSVLWHWATRDRIAPWLSILSVSTPNPFRKIGIGVEKNVLSTVWSVYSAFIRGREASASTGDKEPGSFSFFFSELVEQSFLIKTETSDRRVLHFTHDSLKTQEKLQISGVWAGPSINTARNEHTHTGENPCKWLKNSLVLVEHVLESNDIVWEVFLMLPMEFSKISRRALGLKGDPI